LPEDQIPLEPLSRKRREELADALVNLLLNRKVVEQQKKATATEYNEELKALDTDIDAITKALNQPHVEYDDDGTPDPEYPTDHLERAMAGVPMANEIAAGADGKTVADLLDGVTERDEEFETIEVTEDDLETTDDDIVF
jgi:hypothetical protein